MTAREPRVVSGGWDAVSLCNLSDVSYTAQHAHAVSRRRIKTPHSILYYHEQHYLELSRSRHPGAIGMPQCATDKKKCLGVDDGRVRTCAERFQLISSQSP